MKVTQTGRAFLAPVALRARCWSSPTQTPASRFGVKPTNQASRPSLVVPVFAAVGRVQPQAGSERAVPCATTVCSSEVTRYAIAGSSTGSRRAGSSSKTAPSASTTAATRRGGVRNPPSAKGS